MILDLQGKEYPVPEAKVIEAQAKAQSFNAGLAEKREILDMDKLASLINPGVTHEMSFDKLHAHFFSINGVLNGKKIKGALFAGECILVHADTLKDAADLAKRGIRSTVEAAHEWYAQQRLIDTDTTILQAGSMAEAAGRRAANGRPTPIKRVRAIEQQMELTRMIQDAFKGTGLG